MKQYIYYNQHDTEQEPQGVIEANDLHEAYIIGAAKKQLEFEVFKELFIVIEKNGK